MNTLLRRAALCALLSGLVSSHAQSVHPKIDPDAVSPITQKGYPKTFAEWGPAGVRKINSLLRAAAEKAALSPDCDRVELVELSGERSVPGKKIVFFVDCANRARIYISESDLASQAAIQSQTTKMARLSDADAIHRCREAIKLKLENPMTLSANAFSTSVSRAAITGNVLVQFTFEAKNNLGATLPASARCIFTDRGIEEASISKR